MLLAEAAHCLLLELVAREGPLVVLLVLLLVVGVVLDGAGELELGGGRGALRRPRALAAVLVLAAAGLHLVPERQDLVRALLDGAEAARHVVLGHVLPHALPPAATEAVEDGLDARAHGGQGL